MNRLQLCQQVNAILRFDGVIGTDPTTTTGQTGRLYEVVNWVDLAYADIQNEQDEWKFRVKRGSIQTVDGTRQYAIDDTVTDYQEILPTMAQSDERFITFYLTDDGVGYEQRCWFVPYELFTQGVFDMGTRPEGPPVRFTIHPNGAIIFDPTPDDAYTIVFDYRRTLHTLTTDSHATTGTPIIPTEHHMAIVWRACLYHVLTRESPEQAKWERELAREMNRLRAKQLPEVLL